MAYGVHSDVAQDQFGNPVANASVTVYTVSGGVVQSTPLPSIYTSASSITGSPVTQPNPMTTDSLGRYAFGAPDGFYAIDISGSNFATYRVYKNFVAAYLPGAGGVSNVALALPSQFAISGSPVTGTGTLTGSWSTQANNLVFAGPSTGGPLSPTFRSLVASDLPNTAVSAGSKQSINTGTGDLSLCTFIVDAQGRLTSATLTNVNIGLPGVQNTWTKSQNVALVSLAFATPLVTDTTLGNVFQTTATSNFVLANPTGLVSGGTYIWNIKQDGVGSRLISSFGTMWKFPTGVTPALSTTAGASDIITGVYDGTYLRANITPYSV